MFNPNAPLAILGLVLSISGIIAGGYLLLERLFSSKLFSIFLIFTPNFLQAIFPHDPAITWFRIRSNRNLYDSWDVSFIYFLLLPIISTAMIGFWAFLVLRICGVYDLGTSWLTFWFVMLCLNYMWSAVNQYAIEIKAKHRKASVKRIKGYIIQDPIATLKKWLSYFFRNWIKAPLTALELLLIVVLFILLHWPAWLLRGVSKIQINLNDANARKYYYTGYMVVFLAAGLLLMFFFD